MFTRLDYDHRTISFVLCANVSACYHSEQLAISNVFLWNNMARVDGDISGLEGSFFMRSFVFESFHPSLLSTSLVAHDPCLKHARAHTKKVRKFGSKAVQPMFKMTGNELICHVSIASTSFSIPSLYFRGLQRFQAKDPLVEREMKQGPPQLFHRFNIV